MEGTGGWKRILAQGNHPIWGLFGQLILCVTVFAIATWSNVQSFDFDMDGELGTIIKAMLGLGMLGGGKAAWDKFGPGGNA
jgi:hypothetical protein